MTNSTDPIFFMPEVFFRTARALVQNGKAALAISFVDKAVQEQPDNALLAALGRTILSQGVAGFHHGMLNDSARNAAYRRAIELAAPGRGVLDIGSGSGLLAMMAARAGAEWVVTCEADPLLAATAREIIAANGLSDRITVKSCHSTDLDRERDLHGGPNLVVSELFSHELLGEGVLTSLAHARTALCLPDAIFVPPSAEVLIALADFPKGQLMIGDVEGFDLSLFARHFQRTYSLGQRKKGLELRSQPAALFNFAFSAGAELPDSRQEDVELVSTGGRVSGVAQWIRLPFAPDNVYENGPGGDETLHWAICFTPFAAARETARGEIIRVTGWHNATHVVICKAN